MTEERIKVNARTASTAKVEVACSKVTKAVINII